MNLNNRFCNIYWYKDIWTPFFPCQSWIHIINTISFSLALMLNTLLLSHLNLDPCRCSSAAHSFSICRRVAHNYDGLDCGSLCLHAAIVLQMLRMWHALIIEAGRQKSMFYWNHWHLYALGRERESAGKGKNSTTSPQLLLNLLWRSYFPYIIFITLLNDSY